MVKVGDFWIDRYEASLWDSSTCSGTQYGAGTTDNYPVGFPDTGNATTPVFACSIPAVTPSRMMTWFQAEQACSAMGKRLCRNDEWQAAVAGTFDPADGVEDPGTAQCVVNPTNTGPRATDNTVVPGAVPSSPNHCISRYGAEDMIGNLMEWTSDWFATGMTWQASANQESAAVWGATYGSDSTWNVNGNTYNGTAYTNGLPAAGLRGGRWNYGVQSGAFSVDLGYGPSHWNTNIGARCCRVR
jgi:formylglycine-generating enzyme required for sulfatase activity